LDRFMSNISWKVSFPNARVIHLTHTHSDHHPILLDTMASIPQTNKPFQFIATWLSHLDFINVVKSCWEGNVSNLKYRIKEFSRVAKDWKKEVFGNIFKRKRNILAKLGSVQKYLMEQPLVFLSNLDLSLSLEHNEMLKQEELLWLQK
ncbi:hypothetical protein CFOL_v3_14291, partial [Cephalotus follicularis]